MALTAGQIQLRLTEITKARDSGVLMVRHGDTSTQFRSLAEMNNTITTLQRQLDKVNGVKKSRVNYISQDTKGF